MMLFLFLVPLASSKLSGMGGFLLLFIVKDSAIFLKIGVLKLTRSITIYHKFLLGVFIFMAI